MTHRLFTRLLYALLGLFIALNALIWFGWTREITNPLRKGGDLVRIGYLHGLLAPRLAAEPLDRRFIPVREYAGQPVDLLTVGDSFSVGGRLDNADYQDHLASRLRLTVLNVPSQQGSSFYPVQMLARLINSGYLDQVKPRYVLLESVEREAVNRLAHSFSLADTATREELLREFAAPRHNPLDSYRDLRFINNGNWQFVANTVQYALGDSAFRSKVLVSRLKSPMFATRRGDLLVFHKDDATAARKATPRTMALVNDNLNRLADILRAKGIGLIFMPAPDKLTLYGPYLVRSDYPRSAFFAELRRLPRRYLFIDTEAILAQELAKGTLDLYYQDDTHWSWKACKAIAAGFRLPASSTALPAAAGNEGR